MVEVFIYSYLRFWFAIRGNFKNSSSGSAANYTVATVIFSADGNAVIAAGVYTVKNAIISGGTDGCVSAGGNVCASFDTKHWYLRWR